MYASSETLAVTRTLSRADEALAEHPIFAEPATILQRRIALHQLMLEAVVERLPAIGDVAQQLAAEPTTRQRKILDDCVIRLALHQAFNKLAQDGLEESNVRDLREIFRFIPMRLADAEAMSPLEAEMGERISLGPPGTTEGTWVWRGGSNSPYVRQFERQFIDNCLTNMLTGVKRDGELLEADEGMVLALRQGCALLFELFPRLARSVMSHVRIAAWVRAHTTDAAMQSGSARTIPGVIFLSENHLRNPWTIAESLLHEALHNKLFDLYLTRLILHPDYQAASALRIVSPWNQETTFQTNRWPMDQAFAAFHVYVYLAFFAAMANAREAELAPRFGAIDRSDPSLTCWVAHERARYLGQQLQAAIAEARRTGGVTGLGPDGEVMVDWLVSELDTLHEPPAAAAAAPSRAIPEETRLQRLSNLRVRGGDEGFLLVYTPKQPDLHWLNETVSGVYHRCDGRTIREIESEYSSALGAQAEPGLVTLVVQQTVGMLLQQGIIEIVT